MDRSRPWSSTQTILSVALRSVCSHNRVAYRAVHDLVSVRVVAGATHIRSLTIPKAFLSKEQEFSGREH